MKIATLTPAYGRDYKSRKEILAALEAGTDFVIHTHDGGSTYVNLPQLSEDGFTDLNVRHAKRAKLTVVKLSNGGVQ